MHTIKQEWLRIRKLLPYTYSYELDEKQNKK